MHASTREDIILNIHSLLRFMQLEVSLQVCFASDKTPQSSVAYFPVSIMLHLPHRSEVSPETLLTIPQQECDKACLIISPRPHSIYLEQGVSRVVESLTQV